MNLTQYQPLALRTEKPLPTQRGRLEHAILGLITETGEFTTEVKRIAIYGKGLDDVDPTGVTRAQHMAEEIGDVMWYLAIAADAVGYQLEDIFYLDLVDPLISERLTETSFRFARHVGKLSELLSEHLPQPKIVGHIGHILHLCFDSARDLGTTLKDICAENIAKLQLRYPEKYSDEAAEARADKGGADARNS